MDILGFQQRGRYCIGALSSIDAVVSAKSSINWATSQNVCGGLGGGSGPGLIGGRGPPGGLGGGSGRVVIRSKLINSISMSL